MRMNRATTWLAVLLSCGVAWAQGTAPTGTERAAETAEQTVELTPARDTTLIESPAGALANGTGPALFVGRTRQPTNSRRRALVVFDVSTAAPASAQVVSVTLTLTLQQTHAPEEPITLHRVLADWGEGASKSPGGRGAPVAPGDATWTHTFFPDRRWSRAGGDHAAEPTATLKVGDAGVYTWGPGARMTADVQEWLGAGPQRNFGWLLLGNEKVEGTAKSFASRESDEPAARPRLRLTFRSPKA
jgi:hypothetical protein